MNKPNDYDQCNVNNFVPVEIGGHKAVIKNVKEGTNKNNGEMIIVSFDFTGEDKQPGYMTNEFKNDIRPEKKWPHSGTTYINVKNDDGTTNKSFKRFITNWEKSNNKKMNWDASANQFANGKIGAVFGIVENEYNGKVTKRHELRWFCEYDKAFEASIPEEKLLSPNSAPQVQADGFTAAVPDGVDGDEYPWN